MNEWLKNGLIILAVLLVAFLAFQARNYYTSTYVGEDYYAQVPASQDTKIDEWSEDSYTIRGKQYKFSAYNSAGQSKVVEFDIRANVSWDETISADKLLQPNTYLKINASANRVIDWKIIRESDVPAQALAAIKANR